MAAELAPARLLLAIESSCDETAAAVIDESLVVRSSVVASQFERHEMFGGVVPEIASRAHLENLVPVLDACCREAEVTLQQIDAVAVTVEPGLVGSLLVGLTAAKTLAWTLGVPLVAIDHVRAHLYACRMDAGEDIFPAVGLVVSGGHTSLFRIQSATDTTLIGATIDDAAGEAFDKAAALLGLGYPGGPAISAAAQSGDPAAFSLPRPMIHKGLDFSFSGLKTAIRYAALGKPGEARPGQTPSRTADLAASFQLAVVETLVAKCRRAIRETGLDRLCVGGGVAANTLLRKRLAAMCEKQSVALHIAPPAMCTDNAAMAGLAWEHLAAGESSPLDLDVRPGLVRSRPQR